MNYWVPGTEVSGLHELVGNALIMDGEIERTLDLREEPLPDLVDDGTRVFRRSFAPCDGGTETVFYRVENGGHTWPKGPLDFDVPFFGLETQDLDASRTVAEFLLRFRR